MSINGQRPPLIPKSWEIRGTLLANISEVEEIAQHSIWKNPQLIQELDRSIGSNLGTLRYIKITVRKFHNFQILREINFFRPHGPPMLAWMLSHYLVDRQVGKFKSLGERAFQLNVIEFLT